MGNKVKVSSDTWESSQVKEIMAHFPGRNVFSSEWIDQFTATTINRMSLEASKAALLSAKPGLKQHFFIPELTKF